jgi:hypothetical protein
VVEGPLSSLGNIGEVGKDEQGMDSGCVCKIMVSTVADSGQNIVEHDSQDR